MKIVLFIGALHLISIMMAYIMVVILVPYLVVGYLSYAFQIEYAWLNYLAIAVSPTVILGYSLAIIYGFVSMENKDK